MGGNMKMLTEEEYNRLKAEAAEGRRLKALINKPELLDFAKAVPMEWADSAICLKVFEHYAKINGHQVMREKLDVLWDRKWSTSPGGALYRPGVADLQTESA